MTEPSKTEIMLGRDFTQREAQTIGALEDAAELIESVLPATQKGQAERYVRCAALYFCKNQELAKKVPTLEAFTSVVLDAARLGLVIDGSLCHVSAYKNRKTGVHDITLLPDYKGLVAVAKRSPGILDCYGRLVHERDKFEIGHDLIGS